MSASAMRRASARSKGSPTVAGRRMKSRSGATSVMSVRRPARTRRASRVSSAATPPPAITTRSGDSVMPRACRHPHACGSGDSPDPPRGSPQPPAATPVGTTDCARPRRAYGRLMPRHIVIAGGGIAGLETLLALSDLAEDRVRLTLVSPDSGFEVKALRTAEPFSVDHVRRYSLPEIGHQHGAEFIRDAVASVDPAAHTVTLAENGEQ